MTELGTGRPTGHRHWAGVTDGITVAIPCQGFLHRTLASVSGVSRGQCAEL